MLRLVAATRLDEATFGREARLARSIESLRNRIVLSAEIAFENATPLPTVFNDAIERAADDDVLLFTHDDVSLLDPELDRVLEEALGHTGVVGVAGNVRRRPRQVAWHALAVPGPWDWEGLSGEIAHDGAITHFGPAPRRVALIDGVLIAARAGTLRRAGVRFDPRFAFHFYDLDFCRACEAAGLTIGTWPLRVDHASVGAFGSSDWNLTLYKYRAKWRD